MHTPTKIEILDYQFSLRALGVLAVPFPLFAFRFPLCPVLLTLLLATGPAAWAQSGDALIQLKTAAEAGDPAAQYQMADRDPARAESWLRQSAAQGYAPAEGKLGNLLLNRGRMGIGMTPPAIAAVIREALQWMGQAASHGDHLGQANLADLCLEGKWVKQDLVAAYQWSDLACQGVSFEGWAVLAHSTRDNAILKMTAAQLAEGQRRVAAFKPRPPAKPAAASSP